MPNRSEHFWIGALLTGLGTINKAKMNNKKISLGKLFNFSLLGGGVALLPDYLEPANNPNHRKFFHSKTLGLGLLDLGDNIRNRDNLTNDKKEFWDLMLLAFGSHLVADSFTPKGLPLF